MNEKRNDRQQGGAGRDGGMKEKQGGQNRQDQNPDRSRTGQVGGEGRDEDKARQGRGLDKGQLPHKPGRKPQEDVE